MYGERIVLFSHRLVAAKSSEQNPHTLVALPFRSACADDISIQLYIIPYEQCRRRRRPSSALSATTTAADASNSDFGPSSLPAHVCTRGNPTSAVSLAETFSGKPHPPINIICAPAS